MSKKKPEDKGKLDRSATVNIGGTIFNVHPKVKNTMDGLYHECVNMGKYIQIIQPFEKSERELLNKIVTTFDPMPDLPPELVKIVQDIKDLMKKAEQSKNEESAKENSDAKPVEATVVSSETTGNPGQ